HQAAGQQVQDATHVRRAAPRQRHHHVVAAQVDHQVDLRPVVVDAAGDFVGHVGAQAEADQHDMGVRLFPVQAADVVLEREQVVNLALVNVDKAQLADKVAQAGHVAGVQQVHAVDQEDVNAIAAALRKILDLLRRLPAGTGHARISHSQAGNYQPGPH